MIGEGDDEGGRSGTAQGGRAPSHAQPPEPSRLFLSYAHTDRPRVALLARALEERGYAVWWDAMIEGGAAFGNEIEARLDAAGAVVVVWSKQSIRSDWVRDEAGHARDAQKLVPVSIDGALPPLGFRQYHVVDLSRWSGQPTAPEFAGVLKGIAAAQAGTARAAADAPALSRRSISRRKALVGAGGLAVAGTAAALGVMRPWRASAKANSVAVLPFRNLGGDPAQNYFSEGLAEEVRAALTRNPALEVAAPTSSNLFRDDAPDAREIGTRLKVAHLLEGSVRKERDVVRVAAELVDTRTGFTIWSEDFERKIADVFAVQSEIATTVADALAVRVAQPKNLPGGTKSSDAYDAYLRGRALFNADEGETSDRAALAQFDAAIGLDGGYAAAHAARSRSLAAIATQYASADALKDMYDQAIEAARRAVVIAPELPASHLALGYALFTGRLDFGGARVPFERAAELGKGDADILTLFSLYASKAGRGSAARDAVERAVSLDALNPRAWRAAASVAYAAKRYSDVIPAARQALALNPKLSNAEAMIGNALFALGRHKEALAAYAAESNRSFRLAGLAVVRHRLGDSAGAKQAMAELASSLGDSASYQQAQIEAQWGDADAAFAALEKARIVGDSGLLYLPTDPMLESLRSDPRYLKLLKAMRWA